MRYLIIFFLALVLSSCFIYSSKDDCIYGLTSTQCFGESYSPVANFKNLIVWDIPILNNDGTI